MMKRRVNTKANAAVSLVIVTMVGCVVSANAATVAYWRFEDNNGSFVADGVSVPTLGTPILDETGNHNSVLVGTTDVTWQGGDAGELFGSQVPNPDPIDTDTNSTLNAGGVNTRSLFFDIDADYISIPDDDALDFSGAFTLEGYFRVTRASEHSIILNKRSSSDAAGAGYKVYVEEDTGVLVFGLDNGPTWKWIGFDDAALNDGVWHHFAAIRDGSDGLHIWADGVEDVTPAGTATALSGDLSNSQNLMIGNDLALRGRPSMDGYLDEIRISDAALTSEQFLFLPIVYPPGDANRDEYVNAADAAILAENWLMETEAGWAAGDFNEDGIVDDIDATIMAANWRADPGGGNVTVPEPASFVMIVVGLVSILLSRRTQK